MAKRSSGSFPPVRVCEQNQALGELVEPVDFHADRP